MSQNLMSPLLEQPSDWQATFVCGFSLEATKELVAAVVATVVEWAEQKWPHLDRAALSESTAHWQRQGATLATHRSDVRGALQWAFSSEHPDACQERWWLTRVLVRHKDDVLSVRVCNAFKGLPAAQATQPRFVRLLAQGLRARDGGVEVLPRPLFVQHARAAQDFYDHLLNIERELPLVVLAADTALDEEAPTRYGVNPFNVSQWLCALGHVVCIGAQANQGLKELIGPWCTVPAGGARVFLPGFDYGSAAADHPAYAAEREVGSPLGPRLCKALYALSAQATAQEDFEHRWRQATAS